MWEPYRPRRPPVASATNGCTSITFAGELATTPSSALDLDFERLANELVMSGGYIKNAVLRAAFLAAEESAPITNEHLWRAARSEYESLGKISFQHTRLRG